MKLPFAQLNNNKEPIMTLRELVVLTPVKQFNALRRWWSEQLERHYLICADVEHQRQREASLNASYYQKRAALARANRILYE